MLYVRMYVDYASKFSFKSDWQLQLILSFMQFNFAGLTIGLQSGVEIFRLEENSPAMTQSATPV